MVLWWNRFWTMYMTLMFLWWIFFVNSEATLWSVSSMRSSKMIKCFSLGSKLSRSGKPCWNSIPFTVPYNAWYSPKHLKIRSGLGVIMCLILWTNHRTNIDFPLPVGPAITLVNGCTHGMKWSGSYPSGTQKNRIIGFQNIVGLSFITLWVFLLLRLRRYTSICQRRRRWCISLCQRLLGYLVEIPQWERGRDRKHHLSTTQHLEQLRSHPKGNHPLSVWWRQFLWRHFRSRHIQ